MEIVWFVIGALAGAVLVALYLRGREERAQSCAAMLVEQLETRSDEHRTATARLSSDERELAEAQTALKCCSSRMIFWMCFPCSLGSNRSA